ncbi:MAG: hypothetical protein R3B72_23240 [Polyangiaceae bacterium]
MLLLATHLDAVAGWSVIDGERLDIPDAASGYQTTVIRVRDGRAEVVGTVPAIALPQIAEPMMRLASLALGLRGHFTPARVVPPREIGQGL